MNFKSKEWDLHAGIRSEKVTGKASAMLSIVVTFAQEYAWTVLMSTAYMIIPGARSNLQLVRIKTVFLFRSVDSVGGILPE